MTPTRFMGTCSTPIRGLVQELQNVPGHDAEGKAVEYVHRLVPRELYNNSFAAVSPDDQWMVAGEWETMSHLQIYPTPILNRRTAPNGGSLKLAGFIKLDHMVNDIQGCVS